MPLFDPTLDSPIVRVVPNDDRTFMTISWPANPFCSGFKVYGGYDPLHIRSVISGLVPLPNTATQFVFRVPMISPPTKTTYYWVSSLNPSGGETFLDDVGSYVPKTMTADAFSRESYCDETESDYILSSEQKYYFEEIRRRVRAISDDVSEDGWVDLYIRQWIGLPDTTAQAELGEDTDYQGMTRNSESFGTGFYPGFFPAIKIPMRFGALPNSLFDYQLPGMRPMLTNEAWTLWEPLISENDLIVRRTTGVRYIVKTTASSNKKGAVMVQRLSLDIVEPTSPLQKVTDLLLRDMWGKVNAVDYARVGWSIAADQFGGPDKLVFSNG